MKSPVDFALSRLAAGHSLTAPEAEAAVGTLLDGGATDLVAAAFLTALKVRRETADELEGAVNAVRARMIAWQSGATDPSVLLDTCGTGGDGAHTVNISTAAAIVVAAAGIPVVKHGNRAASGNSGSSDVLNELGIPPQPDADLLRRQLHSLGIAFLFAPTFHPGLVRLAPIRRQLPFRTLFNLVGPLCNPAAPRFQLVGTPTAFEADLMASVLSRQPHIERAVVVTGSDGLDEVTLGGQTLVTIVATGQRNESLTLSPADFGLKRQTAEALRVASPAESAHRLLATFRNEIGPVRDYVLANSATALWTTGRFTLAEGMTAATAAIDSGAALRLLAAWRDLCATAG